MLKKIFCFILISFCMVVGIFASNLQKTYTVNDDIYKRVDILCREAGIIGPSSFSPMSGQVLLIALDRIDYSSLSPDLKDEYDYLRNMIEQPQTMLRSDYFAADFNIGANLQFNIADYSKFIYGNGTGEPKWTRQNDALIPYRYEAPALSFYPELYFGDNVFLEADFSIKNNPYRMYESSFGWLMTGVSGNFVFFGNGTNSSFAPELPYKAGASIGNDYFNLIIGRYPHSIGSGITGNMVVGDNFTYQEVMNVSLLSNYFTYNISVTRFDQQIVPDSSQPYLTNFSRNEFRGDQQFRVVHRFDITAFNKVRFAIDLGTLYNSTYGFDVRFFYPFVISHNYFNYSNVIEKTYFDEANNIMGFELEFVPWYGITVGAQFVLDQAQMYFEDATSIPSAYGFLANVKFSKKVMGGTVNTWFEGAYTNPYLYLNGKRNDGGAIDYNLDYVVGYHVQYLDSYGYSGYIYGPDSIVFSLGGEYLSQDLTWRAGINLQYQVSGEKGLKHSYKSNQITTIDMSHSIIEDDPDIFMNAVTPTGGWADAEHLLKIALFGNYEFSEYNLDLFAALGINSYFNFNHETGNTQVLPQFSFGVKWNGLNLDWFDGE